MDDGSPAGQTIIALAASKNMVNSDLLTYLLAFFVLMVFSAFFSGVETALSVVNKIRMMSYADDGKKSAKRVLYILENYDDALTTILIGNNIVNISMATISTLLAGVINGMNVSVATLLTAICIFFFGEMIPKCFANDCNEKWALFASAPIVILMKFFRPLVFVFGKLSALIKKPFSKISDDAPTVTEDEIYDIVDSYVEESVEEDEEMAQLFSSALEFSDLLSGEIVTPWEQVDTLYMYDSLEETVYKAKSSGYSRFPVVGKSGNVLGIVQIRKLLKRYIETGGEGMTLRSVMDKPYFVSDKVPLDELLSELSARKITLAVVRNSEKKILGILTVEDILEELVGEIYDEEDARGGEAG
ncbi:MAG: HlyC/CorC family transporter [Ruminococcaceae bacterium]|nr:HlyC/CorC family transporter [Oscillospiraceae bacterium]